MFSGELEVELFRATDTRQFVKMKKQKSSLFFPFSRIQLISRPGASAMRRNALSLSSL